MTKVAEIILHHYPTSPFSERVRLTMGLKGLSYRSVFIPPATPKHEAILNSLVASGHSLTPGFRDPRYPIEGREPRFSVFGRQMTFATRAIGQTGVEVTTFGMGGGPFGNLMTPMLNRDVVKDRNRRRLEFRFSLFRHCACLWLRAQRAARWSGAA